MFQNRNNSPENKWKLENNEKHIENLMFLTRIRASKKKLYEKINNFLWKFIDHLMEKKVFFVLILCCY